MSSTPPFHHYAELVRWIQARSAWEELTPLLATGNARYLRLVYRHASPDALTQEQLEPHLRQMSGRGVRLSPELLAISANPSLSAPVRERLFQWIGERMRESRSWNPREDTFQADEAELLLLRTLEEAGHATPRALQDCLREVLLREDEEGMRAQAALFLMEMGVRFGDSEEESLWEAAKGSAGLALRIVLHPHISLGLKRRLATQFAQDRFVLRELARHPETREDPEIRELLLDSGCYLPCEALLPGASPEEVRRLFRGILRREPVHALQFLEDVPVEQGGALEPEDLLPLLESSTAALRMHAQLAWARLRGEAAPEKKAARGRRVG